MQQIFKKLISLITACVIAVSGAAVSVSAADYFDINIGSSRTDKMDDNSKLRYFFESDKECELTLNISFTGRYLACALVGDDENGTIITEKPTEVKSTKGTAVLLEVEDKSGFTVKNSDGNGCSCKIKYKISKGSHLFTFSNEHDEKEYQAGGDLTVKLTASSKSPELDRFTVTLSKGSTLSLGTLLTDGTSGSVKWSSSKKTVAKVSSKGKVTAKAKGTAVITAAYGDSKMKITVIVK